MRADEIEGRDYYFVSEERFKKKLEEGKFLEWARVHDYLYGTLTEEVARTISQGKNVLLEIDSQGALQIKKSRPDSISIFIKPPSLKVLEKRLRRRGTEEEQAIIRRLNDAKSELDQADKYDYVIINDRVDKASKKFEEIIQKESEKCLDMKSKDY